MEVYLGIASLTKNIGQIYCLNNRFLKIAKERIGEEKLLKLFEIGRNRWG